MDTHGQSGFTLIESLVVMAIAGLLLALGVPMLQPAIAAADARAAAIRWRRPPERPRSVRPRRRAKA